MNEGYIQTWLFY